MDHDPPDDIRRHIIPGMPQVTEVVDSWPADIPRDFARLDGHEGDRRAWLEGVVDFQMRRHCGSRTRSVFSKNRTMNMKFRREETEDWISVFNKHSGFPGHIWERATDSVGCPGGLLYCGRPDAAETSLRILSFSLVRIFAFQPPTPSATSKSDGPYDVPFSSPRHMLGGG